MNKDWTDNNLSILNEELGFQVEHDLRKDTRLLLRELSKPIIFVVQEVGTRYSEDVTVYGFDSFEEVFDLLMRDMLSNVYPDSEVERFRMVKRNEYIRCSFFQGRVVRFLPVTREVAILTRDENNSFNGPLDVLSGLIPYTNMHIEEENINDELKESEKTPSTDEGFNGKPLG
jgi:hypothetical protein